jgi:outer membrane protein assembly factor BamB
MRPLLALGALVLLAGAGHAADWPQFHADTFHTGVVRSDFAVPKERWWSRSTGDAIEGGPVVSDGRVFVGSTDGKMYGFDAISGSQLWAFDAHSPISTTPALSGGVLYLVTNDGKLFALDAVTGKQRPSAGQGNPDPGPTRTSPSIHQGRLYLGTEAGSLIAYNLYTLTKDWEYRIADERWAAGPNQTNADDQVTSTTCRNRFAPAAVRSSPAVYQNHVFFGSDAHALFAVDEFGLGGEDTGRTQGVWEEEDLFACPAHFPADTPFPPAPRVPMLGDVIRAAPAIDTKNGLVVVASYDNTVRAYDAADGELRWNFSITDAEGCPSATACKDSRVISTPAVDNGTVYFGAFNGRFYAVQTTGSGDDLGVRLLWTQLAQDAIWSSPAVSNGLVAFGADDETVYLLSAATGQRLWSSRTGGDVRSSPAIWSGAAQGTTITGGLLYVGSSDGILYAYGGTKPPLADLAITNISYPADPFWVDSDVAVQVNVRNAGTLLSPATEVKLFIDGVLATTQPIAALSPGGTAQASHTWRVPAGNHTIVAIVDPAMLSREFDRGNNEVKVETPVAKAQPPPAPPPASTQPGSGSGEPRAAVPGPGAGVAAAALAITALALAARRRR